MRIVKRIIEKLLLAVLYSWFFYYYSQETTDPALTTILIKTAEILNVKPFKKIKIFNKLPLINAATILCREIVITEALLATMDIEEIEAVILHEYAHCKKKHLFTRLILAIGLLPLIILPPIVIYVFFSSTSTSQKLLDLVIATTILVSFITYVLIIMHVIRKHEYEADLLAAQALKNPIIFVNMLKKLKSQCSKRYRKIIEKLFSTHPCIEERIENIFKKLRQMK